MALVNGAEHFCDARRRDRAAAMRDRLVEERKRIAHAPRRCAREQR